MAFKDWSRSEKLTLLGVIVAVLGVLAAGVVVPEFRQIVGLEQPSPFATASPNIVPPSVINNQQTQINNITQVINRIREKREINAKEKNNATSQANGTKSFLCPKFSKPTLNPFPVTFDDLNTPLCSVFPVIDIANDIANPRFAQSNTEHSSIRKFDNADQLVALLYILNGADETLPPNTTIAKNVKITTSLSSNGNTHILTATYTGDDISPLTNSITVQTNPNESLEILPNSGYMYSYEGKIILDQQNLNLGNSTFTIGQLDAGMQYSLFFTYKIKVVRK